MRETNITLRILEIENLVLYAGANSKFLVNSMSKKKILIQIRRDLLTTNVVVFSTWSKLYREKCKILEGVGKRQKRHFSVNRGITFSRKKIYRKKKYWKKIKPRDEFGWLRK